MNHRRMYFLIMINMSFNKFLNTYLTIFLMATFGMYPTVDFLTRIYNNSVTTIDNILLTQLI